MKIIFSRKGFDSSAGGCPSPIITGRPISLPIPTSMPSPTLFGDLPNDLPEIISQLSKGKISKTRACHLDPDLDANTLPRKPGWRGSLGQVSAAQSHLNNQAVGPGDLFLFWGLFRPAVRKNQWIFTGPKQHRIFGWLQIDYMLDVGGNPHPILQEYPWLADHPHLQTGWSDLNTVYVARKTLKLGARVFRLPGWGLFNSGWRLTVPDSPRPSDWSVPDWLNPKRGGVGMTYNPEQRWRENGLLRSAARGQEFVADIGDRPDAIQWVLNLFEEAA